MSYNKTEGIPHDHPLAQLLARSQRANKLPSCEGCKHGGIEKSITGREFMTCDAPSTGGMSFRFDDAGDTLFIEKPTHFCAAWEPKQ